MNINKNNKNNKKMSWESIVSDIENRFIDIINNTPIKYKWSYIPSDKGYREYSHKAFIHNHKENNKIITSTKDNLINWLTPDYDITFTLFHIYFYNCISGLDDYVLVIPNLLDLYLQINNTIYLNNSSIAIQPIYLPTEIEHYSNHVLLIDEYSYPHQVIVIKVGSPPSIITNFSLYNL